MPVSTTSCGGWGTTWPCGCPGGRRRPPSWRTSSAGSRASPRGSRYRSRRRSGFGRPSGPISVAVVGGALAGGRSGRPGSRGRCRRRRGSARALPGRPAPAGAAVGALQPLAQRSLFGPGGHVRSPPAHSRHRRRTAQAPPGLAPGDRRRRPPGTIHSGSTATCIPPTCSSPAARWSASSISVTSAPEIRRPTWPRCGCCFPGMGSDAFAAAYGPFEPALDGGRSVGPPSSG